MIKKRKEKISMAEIGVGDMAWCLAKQAIDEKWDAAKLGPAIARFAIQYLAEWRGLDLRR